MIWIDLDKTLVYVRDHSEDQTLAMLAPFWGISADVILRPSPRGRRKLRNVIVRGVELRGCLRHCAHDFLGTLRQLAEVRMLTSARRPYALAMNAAFELGFKKTQIFARDDWMGVQKGPRGTARAHGIDPDGVLIDNETDDWNHRRKIGYLGARGRLVPWRTSQASCRTISQRIGLGMYYRFKTSCGRRAPKQMHVTEPILKKCLPRLRRDFTTVITTTHR